MADVWILGTRGVPNRYGGFERLAEVLAPYLARAGHTVTVVCEAPGGEHRVRFDDWRGVRRVHLPVTANSGPRGTLGYDWRAFAMPRRGSVALVFGYGTALFQMRLHAAGVRHAVNMDGIEWKRAKWGAAARLWLRINERAAGLLATELIADHPAIQQDLLDRLGRRSTMIAYGAGTYVEGNATADDRSGGRDASSTHRLLDTYGENAFHLVIARPEPENQVDLVLAAYRASRREVPLLVFGNFAGNAYGRQLMTAYPEATFLGPLYEPVVLDTLRRRSRLYIHGHSVGGTNPSLIEAMAAGALVCAHDNVFNRWVLGEGGLFFKEQADATRHMDNPRSLAERATMLAAAQAACDERFRWADILEAYRAVVDRLVRG